MEKVCIIGSGNTISESIISLLDNKKFEVVRVGRKKINDIQIDFSKVSITGAAKHIPFDCSKYIITLGLLYPKRIINQNEKEIISSAKVNLLAPVMICEKILQMNSNARIALIGSESGVKGSFDTSYFLFKSALSSYVRERKITNHEQQLVLIEPSVIIDSNMTQSRDDLKVIIEKSVNLPKQRFLLASEVADLVYYLLFKDQGYITNTCIQINGGKFARMNYSI